MENEVEHILSQPHALVAFALDNLADRIRRGIPNDDAVIQGENGEYSKEIKAVESCLELADEVRGIENAVTNEVLALVSKMHDFKDELMASGKEELMEAAGNVNKLAQKLLEINSSSDRAAA